MKRVLFALLFTVGLSLQIYPSNSFDKYSQATKMITDFYQEVTLFFQLKSKHNAIEIGKQATILKNEIIKLNTSTPSQHDARLHTTIIDFKPYIKDLQEMEQCFNNAALYMQKDHNAIVCNHQLYVNRFHKIKNRCNITESIQLFSNIPENENVSAFYQPFCKAICINNKDFALFSKPIIDFIFYHELRHHLQFTTAQAKAKVQQYEKSLRLTSSQAMEYDADMFALEKIAKKQCPHCFQELKNLRYNPGLNQNYDSEGYITSFAIEPYLQKAKAHPKICKYHSNPHNQPSPLSAIWNASKSPNCQNYSSLICATIALKATHLMESRNYPTPNATTFGRI